MTWGVISHWIIQDGYYDGTVILATESFTEQEVELLMRALNSALGIKSSKKRRALASGRIGFRIRVSRKSLSLLRANCISYMPSYYMYKLGL